MSSNFTLRRAFACSVLASFLAGCASKAVDDRMDGAGEPVGDANSHLMIAEIALQRGEYNVAALEYVEAAQLSTDPQLAEQATRVAFEYRQESAASAAARRWLELEPTSIDAQRFLAVATLRLHRLDESLDHFRPVLESGYASLAEGFTDLSTTLAEEDNAYGVLWVTRGLAKRHAKLAQAQYAVGAAALRAYNYGLAATSARKALSLDPKTEDAERLLARALVVSGRTDEGLEIARRRVATLNDIASRLELALLLSAANEEAEARELLNALLDLPDARPDALRTLASLDLAAGKVDDATERFNELLGSGRYVSLSLYSLGLIHERRRDPMLAVRYYSRVVSGPYATDAQLRSARLLASTGHRDQAIEMLSAYEQDHPESDVELSLGKARLLAEEGASESALEILDSKITLYPDNLALRFARGVTLERMGRVDEAVSSLRELLALRPGDPVVMNALGYTMAEHEVELREAYDLIRDSLEMTPDSAAVQDSMGWVLHRRGKHRDALGWLTRAYAEEKDAEIAAHLGETLWALGQQSQARAIWDQALAENPDHRYLLDTLNRYPE
jgi:tetratricopeptide (TPR) repeat protein